MGDKNWRDAGCGVHAGAVVALLGCAVIFACLLGLLVLYAALLPQKKAELQAQVRRVTFEVAATTTEQYGCSRVGLCSCASTANVPPSTCSAMQSAWQVGKCASEQCCIKEKEVCDTNSEGGKDCWMQCAEYGRLACSVMVATCARLSKTAVWQRDGELSSSQACNVTLKEQCFLFDWATGRNDTTCAVKFFDGWHAGFSFQGWAPAHGCQGPVFFFAHDVDWTDAAMDELDSMQFNLIIAMVFVLPFVLMACIVLYVGGCLCSQWCACVGDLCAWLFCCSQPVQSVNPKNDAQSGVEMGPVEGGTTIIMTWDRTTPGPGLQFSDANTTVTCGQGAGGCWQMSTKHMVSGRWTITFHILECHSSKGLHVGLVEPSAWVDSSSPCRSGAVLVRSEGIFDGATLSEQATQDKLCKGCIVTFRLHTLRNTVQVSVNRGKVFTIQNVPKEVAAGVWFGGPGQSVHLSAVHQEFSGVV